MFRQSASRCLAMSTSAASFSARASRCGRGSEKKKVSKSKASASIPRCSSKCTMACLCRIEPRSANCSAWLLVAECSGSQHAMPLAVGVDSAFVAASHARRLVPPMATTMAPMPSFAAQAAKRGTRYPHRSPQTKVTATTLRLGAGRMHQGVSARTYFGSCHVQPRSLHPSAVMPEKPHSRLPATVDERTTPRTASRAPAITGRSFARRSGATARYQFSAESSTSRLMLAHPSAFRPIGASSPWVSLRSPYRRKRLL
mmetsp:Transcript_58111/g.180286  ORF Transcript_58111/g.180286 Transcript_58111/m.180286 type:complete len:257 (-) Transcript_58111:393-1163(-)